MKDKEKKKSQKFEDLLAELEETVRELEGGEIGLDEALAKYEKGILALKQCYDILRAAEKKIEILAKNPDGTLSTKPFEGEEAPRAHGRPKGPRKAKEESKPDDPGGGETGSGEESLFKG